MPEIVKEVPGGWNIVGRPSLDYDRLFDGQVWCLRRGADFRGKPINARQSVAKHAKRRNVRVRTKVTDDALYLQMVTAPKEWPSAADRESAARLSTALA